MSAQAEEQHSPTGQFLDFDDYPPAHFDSGGEDGGAGDSDGGGAAGEQLLEELEEQLEEQFQGQFQAEVDRPKSAEQRRNKKRPNIKRSKYGVEYPSLPAGVVKRLAQTFAQTGGAKGKISSDTLAAVMQASDWFFEQLGDDLQAFAKHAGRKTIDETDMLALMRRYVIHPWVSIFVSFFFFFWVLARTTLAKPLPGFQTAPDQLLRHAIRPGTTLPSSRATTRASHAPSGVVGKRPSGQISS